jgi:hypothetical protein
MTMKDLEIDRLSPEQRRVPCFRGSGRRPNIEENHRESM